MSNPLVSVAVVTYNQKAFLEECLNSILLQDYDNIEIVVADDGSTDGTKELLDRFDREHPGKFRIVRSDTNRGVTSNHNLALSACTGEFISWIAGDDLMLPGKITAQARYMIANPDCVICYHDTELFDSDSGQAIQLYSDFDRQRRGTFETLVRYGHFNTGISSMVRASASASSFEASVPTASDWLYYVECLAGGGRIEPIPGIYARQRRHRGNVTGELCRSLLPRLFVEHLQSCAIILGKWPRAARHVRYRMAAVLKQQRWQDDGANYGRFLRASLAYRRSPAVIAALVADRLFGWRR